MSARVSAAAARDRIPASDAGDGVVVSVVIPTRDRPELVRRAVRSVLAQRVDVPLEVIVVFDGEPVDEELEELSGSAEVRVLPNSRPQGLAGSRNTGILAARGALIAFCDDDDVWLPDKLAAQLAALEANPGAEFVTTAMAVAVDGRRRVRLAGTDTVDHTALIRSRMAMLHSSSFLIDARVLFASIGLVEERLPRGMAEDWDLLLRASARRPIVHVDQPLIEVSWSGTSYFIEQWELRNQAHLWLLEHHPEIAEDDRAAALFYGKLAFGSAALGQRRAALGWAIRSLRRRWREPRAMLALLVASRAMSWRRVVGILNARGHGI